jgi:hypothetical protein
MVVGSTRTVLSRLGLRIHSAPMLVSSNVVASFGQGASFTVIGYQSSGGGWFQVQGRTVTGWVVADPTLTAAGLFNKYGNVAGVTAFYPANWGFQQEPTSTIFLPQAGTQNIVLQSGPALASFGPAALPGYGQSTTGPVQVCGYTGTLSDYVKNPNYSGPSPSPLPVPRLGLYAVIRLTFDATHAMQIGFDYSDSSQLDVFEDLYNSIGFPYPLCEAPATTPKASPKP